MKKLLLSLGALSAVVAPVAAVVACGSTTDSVKYKDSIVGKTVGDAQLDVRIKGTKTGALDAASNAAALKAELATLTSINKDPATAGTGYDASYLFLKRTSATPLLDGLVADNNNGKVDVDHTLAKAKTFSGLGDEVDGAAFILIIMKDGHKVDASTFAAKIDGKDVELSFLLSRVKSGDVEHAAPLAFMTTKEPNAHAPIITGLSKA